MQDRDVRAFVWPAEEGAAEPRPFEAAVDAMAQERFAWFALTSAPDALSTIGDRLALHPLALEDCLHGFQAPRALDYGSHLFVIWHALVPHGGKDHRGSQTELDIFVGDRFVVTYTKRPLRELEDLAERVLRREGVALGRPGRLLHALLDSVVDAYFPLLDRVTDEADRLEDAMFQDPRKEDLQTLFAVKRRLLWARKTIAPARDALAILTRHQADVVGGDVFLYFQDVYDHLSRQIDMVDTAREILAGAMDVYLSSVSNRMNEVMKRLTVVATVFMPATLVASIYGMNFARMPGLRWEHGFWAVMLFIVLFSAWMLREFRRRGWW